MEKVREGFPFSPEGLWEEEVRDRERRYFPLSSHTHPALIYPTTHTHTHTTVGTDLLKHPENEKH